MESLPAPQHRTNPAAKPACRPARRRVGWPTVLLAAAILIIAIPGARADGEDRHAAERARLIAAAVAAAHQESILRERAPGSPGQRMAARRSLALRALVAASRRPPALAEPDPPPAPARLAARHPGLPDNPPASLRDSLATTTIIAPQDFLAPAMTRPGARPLDRLLVPSPAPETRPVRVAVAAPVPLDAQIGGAPDASVAGALEAPIAGALEAPIAGALEAPIAGALEAPGAAVAIAARPRTNNASPTARARSPASPARPDEAAAAPQHWDRPTRPTIPLAGRDGVVLPGNGPILRGYGDPGADGEQAWGLEFALGPGAPVVAPLAGTVRFAGWFVGFGPILIIEHGRGYHSLIAGIGRIDVERGQDVLAGEPVGTMRTGGRPIRPAETLYYELRHRGRPVHPISGLAAAQRRGRG